MATPPHPPPPPVQTGSGSISPPPAGTNRRLLHDLTAIASVPADRVQRFSVTMICSETAKHPNLMAGGAVFTPSGPLLGAGLQPVELDDIPRATLVAEATRWVERELDTDLKARVRDSGLLEGRGGGVNAMGSRGQPISIADAPAPRRSGIKVIDLVSAPSSEMPRVVTAGPSGTSNIRPPTASPTSASASKDVESPSNSKKRRLPDTNSDFDSDLDPDEPIRFTWTCNQVRRKILAFLESGEMRVTAFQKHLGVNSNSYNRFMKMSGPWQGVDNSVMSSAYRFFKQRERNGVTVPKKKAKAGPATSTELESVELEGEQQDAVEVYDSCDEIRRKIAAHLRTPGVTQAAFLKDLAAMLHTAPPGTKIQSKQLNDFRTKSGADAGNTSRVFYCAYVFFEKLRIKEGKPKSKHRLEMERRWTAHGGMDTKTPGGRGVYCLKGEIPSVDQYGTLHISRPRGKDRVYM